MKRGSSTRLTEEPTRSVVIVASLSVVHAGRSGGPGADGGGGLANGGNDVLVPGTATQVAFNPVADLVVGGIGVAGEEVGRGHDHARGAEPALQAVLLPEGVLERVQTDVGGHPFDRPDSH